jgi:hypothetical protein
MVHDKALNIYADGSSYSHPRRGGMGIRYVTINSEGDEVVQSEEIPADVPSRQSSPTRPGPHGRPRSSSARGSGICDQNIPRTATPPSDSPMEELVALGKRLERGGHFGEEK